VLKKYILYLSFHKNFSRHATETGHVQGIGVADKARLLTTHRIMMLIITMYVNKRK